MAAKVDEAATEAAKRRAWKEAVAKEALIKKAEARVDAAAHDVMVAGTKHAIAQRDLVSHLLLNTGPLTGPLT